MVNGQLVASPEYWDMDTEVKRVKVTAGETATVMFLNTNGGKVQIVKTMDTDGSLEGWVFYITDQDGTKYGPYTSGEDGTITTETLLPGIYAVEEVIPEGCLYYCKSENPQTVEIKVGETAIVSFANALRPGKMTIEKVDFFGNHLAGAKFLLEWSNDGGETWTPAFYSEEEDVVLGGTSSDVEDGCLVTGDDGVISFENLYPGILYRLTEVEAPDGFVLLSDYAFVGELPIEDLTVTLTVHNSRGFILPESGKAGFRPAAGGILAAAFGMLLGLVLLAGSIVFYGHKTVKNNLCKGENKMRKTHFPRLLSILLCACLLFSLVLPGMAATVDEATIHTDRPASLTIYTYDFTNAAKDGVWSQDSYVSTGQRDPKVEQILGSATRKGASGSTTALENGQNSNGYAIKGKEFTYLKVADFYQFSESERDNRTSGHIEFLYQFDKALASDLLTAIGLTGGTGSYSNANALNDTAWFYQSDVIVAALKNALAANPTGVKDALETYITTHGGVAMPLTDENGYTTATNLPVGLYLLVETKVPEMVTSTTAPFLVSLPMTSVNGGGNGVGGNTGSVTTGGHNWLYDVVVYPKNETGIVTLEKTVREAVVDTGKNSASDGITDGFAHNATGSAGDTMEYQIISTLPTITSQATAISEYTFQDVLSRGLSYVEGTDSVKIEFFTDKACTDKVATWLQSSGKFTVSRAENNDGSHTMTISMSAVGLAEINGAAGSVDNEYDNYKGDNTQYAAYSNYTMRITYSAKLNSDESLVYGDAGNPNEVVLTWKRTSTDYYDTLVDDCHVYSYGINLTKIFSDGKTDQELYDHVLFKLKNATDGCWIIASLDKNEGVWYVTGHTEKESAATAMHPVTWNGTPGQLVIKGLEDDQYILTEIETANSYTLLKENIHIRIVSADDPNRPCDIYDGQEILGIIQNDPRYSFDGGLDLFLENIPQVQLAHNYYTASATVNGNAVVMLNDDVDTGSTNALVPLEVVNTHGWDIPPTGERAVIVLATIGAGVSSFMLVALIFFLIMKKKKGREA